MNIKTKINRNIRGLFFQCLFLTGGFAFSTIAIAAEFKCSDIYVMPDNRIHQSLFSETFFDKYRDLQEVRAVFSTVNKLTVRKYIYKDLVTLKQK